LESARRRCRRRRDELPPSHVPPPETKPWENQLSTIVGRGAQGPLWVKTGKARIEPMFSGSSPKADLPRSAR
jgi:hypothetical protein